MERSGELAFPKSNVSTQLAGHYLQCSWTKADQARTEQSMNEKSEDSIDICSDFCLAFSVTRLILEPRSRRLFPRMGFRPSGRSFRGVQKASVLGSGLVRIRSAKHREKGFLPRSRRSHRFRRTKRRNEPISGLSGKRFSILPSRSKKTWRLRI
jgi:hypothetical protein